MTNIYIVVDSENSDRNTLADLCAAVGETGALVVGVDEQNHMIEAAAPVQEVSTITAMEGVAYVRPIFNYISNHTPRHAA